ncbi:MAG: hypothetical protein ACE5F3_00855 [Mariprofundaceae bacterium]
MKQSELEQFIDELAGAEQAAAVKIQAAEQRWERKIARRRDALEQQRRKRLDALEGEFQQQEDRLREELERYRLQIVKKTDERIAVMQSVYDTRRAEMLNWLLKSVTEP